jgi:hypothetical protein
LFIEQVFDMVRFMELAIVENTADPDHLSREGSSRGDGLSRSDMSSNGPSTEPLAAVLAQLGDRIAPVGLARDRTLPVAEPLRPLFVDDGLVRGRLLSCRGAAASSLAFAVARETVRDGAWMAVVDVATFGADAASEIGVPLERVVRITTSSAVDDLRHRSDDASNRASDRASDRSSDRASDWGNWIDVMGAAIDGFDVVVTRVPASLRGERCPPAVRKLGARLQQRGSIVVVVGDTGVLTSDITLTTRRTVWSGLGEGDGHLRCRQIEVDASGRRQPGVRSCSIELVGVGRRVEMASPRSAVDDPPGSVLSEMAGATSRSDRSESAVSPDRRAAG